MLETQIPTIPGTPFGGGHFVYRYPDGSVLSVAGEDIDGDLPWEKAISACAAYCAGWRAPTEDELALIRVLLSPDTALHQDFKVGGKHAFRRAWYWSGIEDGSGNARSVSFEAGDSGWGGKYFRLAVRPVRKS